MFQLGYQIGLKPNEVLDLSLDQFQACVEGYLDRTFDMQILGVQSGYWAGYWGNPNRKKAKSLKYILESMVKTRKRKTSTVKPDVDVDAFLAREARFKKRQERRDSNGNRSV